MSQAPPDDIRDVVAGYLRDMYQNEEAAQFIARRQQERATQLSAGPMTPQAPMPASSPSLPDPLGEEAPEEAPLGTE